MDMTARGTITLTDLVIDTNIGTYGPGDVIPDHHILDLTLIVPRTAVLIPSDDMAHVFDYDPLIADILQLPQSGHRATQEWLITQIATLCAGYSQIEGVEIYLRKTPVHGGTGTLGVRVFLNHEDLRQLVAIA